MLGNNVAIGVLQGKRRVSAYFLKHITGFLQGFNSNRVLHIFYCGIVKYTAKHGVNPISYNILYDTK